MSRLTDELRDTIIHPNDIDNITVSISQGLVRRAIMRINDLEHRIKKLYAEDNPPEMYPDE